VVEAASWSGALSTARWAADLGREVLAVPGPIQGEANTGSNRLIRDGARPYLEPADLADVLSDRVTPPPAEWVLAPAPAAPEQLLLDRLGAGAVHPDRLAEAIGLAASDLAIRLTELELAGQVRSLPGGLIQRVRRRQ
jgi:DNA processing protein